MVRMPVPKTLILLMLFISSSIYAVQHGHSLRLPPNFFIKVYSSMKQIKELDISNDNIVLAGPIGQATIYVFLPDKRPEKIALVTGNSLKISLAKALYHRKAFLPLVNLSENREKSEYTEETESWSVKKIKLIKAYVKSWISRFYS